MSIALERPEYRDLSEWVVLRILSSIRAKAIVQGERLVERDIALRFDVSRAPVRSAFQMLERIGVVERRHPRGVCVRSWSEHDAMEILYLMDALIFMSIKLAVGRLSETDFAALEQTLAQTKQNTLAATVDRRVQLALDIRFHQIIARATGHRRLTELLDGITLPTDLWPEVFQQRVVPEFSFRQHSEILQALKTGDRAAAVECVIRHQQETDTLELALFGKADDMSSLATANSPPDAIRSKRRRGGLYPAAEVPSSAARSAAPADSSDT